MIRTLSDVPGAVRRVLRKVDFVAKKKLSDQGHAYNCYDEPVVAEVEEANVITSVIEAKLPEFLYDEEQEFVGGACQHAPVLDLDIPCILLPSTTPGHHHLIIDHPMDWGQYLNLMAAMVHAGILEQGYFEATKARGYSSIRLPWVQRLEPREEPQPAPEIVSGNKIDLSGLDSFEGLF